MSLPYNYSKLSKYYEVLEGGKVDKTNLFLEKTLRKYDVKIMVDFACGTGAQALWLAKRGFEIRGVDISPAMIKIVKRRAKEEKVNATFQVGDMRTSKLGTFDGAITIFNAIGHLTKPEFEKSIKNISSNLSKGGVYIFDIFDLEFMRKNFRSYKFLDVAREINGTKFVRFNHNTLDRKSGLMTINQETLVQNGMQKPEVFKERWTMQIYTPKELVKILMRNGFDVLGQYGIDGSKKKSAFVLTVAKKK